MRSILRRLPAIGLLTVLALPASAAQEPDWARRLERQIEAHALRLAGNLAIDAQQRERDDSRGPEVVERFSRNVRLGRGGTFDLSNVAGAIVVTGDGGDEVRIEAVKRTRAPNEADGKARLQEVRIEVRELGNRVEVDTEYPRRRNNRGVWVDYTVAVPRDANVTLKTVSGDTRVTNIRGELRTQSVSGNIAATGARRLSELKTVSGDIQITDAEAESHVNATTVSGDLSIRGLKARGIDLDTVSGDVRLDGMDCGRASVRTVSGDVQYGGALANNGRYDMQTHSGDIRLTVSSSGFDVDATTYSGDVRSDYAVTLLGNQSTERDRRRGRADTTIRGSFGDAGAILSLRSFSGDIAIVRR
jgi:hypothetical protein